MHKLPSVLVHMFVALFCFSDAVAVFFPICDFTGAALPMMDSIMLLASIFLPPIELNSFKRFCWSSNWRCLSRLSICLRCSSAELICWPGCWLKCYNIKIVKLTKTSNLPYTHFLQLMLFIETNQLMGGLTDCTILISCCSRYTNVVTVLLLCW